MVGLRLLFAWLHFVDSACFKRLTLLFLLGNVINVLLITAFGESKPIHHIARVMNFEEWLQFSFNLVLHAGAQCEVQRLTWYRSELRRDAGDVIVDEDWSFINRLFGTACILPETTVICYE